MLEERQEQRLEDTVRVIGRLAHDFGNVLTSVLGFCELAISQLPQDARGMRFVQEAYESAQRGSDLICKLRQLRTAQEGGFVSCSLAEILQEEKARLASDRPEVEWKLDVDEGLPRVQITPSQLRLAVAALLDNAVEAIPEQGTVSVRAHEVTLPQTEVQYVLGSPVPGLYVRLSIHDSGPGFSPKAREQALQTPFFSDKPRHRGYGLTLASGIAQALGGGLRFHFDRSPGALVELYLPSIYTNLADPLTNSTTEPVPGNGDSGGSKSVLVVDDELSVLNMANLILDGAGYRVETTTEGAVAWEKYQSSPDTYDLVLTDWMMPEVSGPELMSRILELRPEQPLLLMSGIVDSEGVHAQFPQPNVRMIPKPFHLSDLLQVIRSLLHRFPLKSSAPLDHALTEESSPSFRNKP